MTSPGSAVRAYRRAVSADRRSGAAHEPVEVPAYETRARTGERAPHRFRWRGRWFRVGEVGAVWQEARPSPSRTGGGLRRYYLVVTTDGSWYEIYFEIPDRRQRYGRWMMYRTIRMGRGSVSTGGVSANG